MATKFEQLLDCLNSYAKALDRITRRRRRWDRERLKTALTIGSAVLSGVSLVVPKARPVAIAVEGLQRAATVSQEARGQAVAEAVESARVVQLKQLRAEAEAQAIAQAQAQAQVHTEPQERKEPPEKLNPQKTVWSEDDD